MALTLETALTLEETMLMLDTALTLEDTAMTLAMPRVLLPL
jgi:hypothetical protein